MIRLMIPTTRNTPEVAYTQLNRLAAHLVPAYQVFTDEEEAEHVRALESRYANI